MAQPDAGGELRRDVPLLLWDGDCGFCAKWVERWKRVTEDRVRYSPYQSFEAGADGRLKDYPNVGVEDCRRSVQLVMPDGAHYQAAEAVSRAFGATGRYRTWLWLYRQVPGLGFLSESVYRFVAGHHSWS